MRVLKVLWALVKLPFAILAWIGIGLAMFVVSEWQDASPPRSLNCNQQHAKLLR